MGSSSSNGASCLDACDLETDLVLFLQPYSAGPAHPTSNAGPYASQQPTRLSHEETRAVGNSAGASASASPPAAEKASADPPASVGSKLKEIARQPRALAGRAQSLDLSTPHTHHHHQQSVDATNTMFSHLSLR